MSDSILPLPTESGSADAGLAGLTTNTPPAPVPMIDLTEQFETIRSEVEDAVLQTLASQRFVLGDAVAEFEHDVATACDATHAVGCGSGTDALILALMALDIGPGDEVITTPFSFFATASSIVRVGATPVFVDIDPVTFNLCPDEVAEAIGPRTRAIMPVHLFGQCCDMDPLWRLAVEHDLHIVEDGAQAIGASYRGRKAGVLGTIGCFSFFPTKNLGGAGDGGIMTTDDADIAARLRRLRVHGDAGGYDHREVGINSRLDALQAAVLSVKLRHLDSWHAARSENAVRYAQMIGSTDLLDELDLPLGHDDCCHVYNQFVIRTDASVRDRTLAGLRDRGVGCAVYYPKPLHLQPCFDFLEYEAGDFPEAEAACEEVIALPIYPELGVERQHRVVGALAETFGMTFSQPVEAFLPPVGQSGRRAA